MSATDRTRIYLEDALDSRPLRGLLLRVPILCGLIMAVEGIDTYGISYVAPFLSRELSIPPERMGMIFTATIVASLLGAIGIAPLSDRIGRRTVLVLSTLLVGPATLLIPLVGNFFALIGLRFVVGLGFGAALPTVIALVAECAPKRYRSMLVMAMSSSVVIGMVLVGIGAGLLIPAFGWKSLMYASGVLSLVFALIAWAFIPESPRFLVKRDPEGPATQSLLSRMLGSAYAPGAQILLEDGTTRASAPVSPLALLRAPLFMKSALLWFLMSVSYMVVNFAVYWLPTIILSQGYTVQDAGVVGSASQSFAVVLAFFIGWMMDRAGMGRVLCFCFVSAALLFAGIAGVDQWPFVAIGFLLLGLSFLSGGISGSLAFIASAYAADIRATALGWVLGLARLIGGSVGTLVGGFLIAAGWTHGEIALSMGIAIALGAAALVTVLRAPAAVQSPA